MALIGNLRPNFRETRLVWGGLIIRLSARHSLYLTVKMDLFSRKSLPETCV